MRLALLAAVDSLIGFEIDVVCQAHGGQVRPCGGLAEIEKDVGLRWVRRQQINGNDRVVKLGSMRGGTERVQVGSGLTLAYVLRVCECADTRPQTGLCYELWNSVCEVSLVRCCDCPGSDGSFRVTKP